MAVKNRETHSNLKQHLLDNSQDYTFNQIYRLITLLLKEQDTEGRFSHDEILQQIKVRPDLTLQFPSSDVTQIVESVNNGSLHYQITVTFLGLYGTSSPLPTFYTENLFRDASEDNSLTREFIDIFNNHFYQLFFKIWSNHRLSYQVFEAKNSSYLSHLYSLGGLSDESIRNTIPSKYNILRYIGVMGHLPRSALGLKILLADLLRIKEIEIIQCRDVVLAIPDEQRLLLGLMSNSLGDSTHLGEQVISANHAFTIKIGPVEYDEYKNLVPDSEKAQLIHQVVSLYIDQPLIWDVEIVVLSQELSTVGLGTTSWAGLGIDTWLFANKLPKKREYLVHFK